MLLEVDGRPWRTVPDRVVVRCGLAADVELTRPLLRHLRAELRDADDPLPDQGRESVHHLILLPTILKARRDPFDQPNRAIGMPQQQPAAIRGHGAAVERRHHPAPSEAFKLELF